MFVMFVMFVMFQVVRTTTRDPPLSVLGSPTDFKMPATVRALWETPPRN